MDDRQKEFEELQEQVIEERLVELDDLIDLATPVSD